MLYEVITALLVAACLVFSLTACGSGNDTTAGNTGKNASQATGNNDNKANDSGSNDSTAGESEATAAPREAELNIMMSFPQYMDQWETYCKQFEDKMLAEENIKVKVNLEMPSSDQYDSVLQARLTGDDAPDLYTIHSNNLETYYNAGYIKDLSSEVLAGKIYDDVKKTVTVDGKLSYNFV